ncbi:RimK family alpha-L-glutamate ligase [bacterium]|nr:RimK family alpha-L-glutamate ligase [bacterium]
MNIAILSRAPRSYSTRRLREAAQARGHAVRVLDTLRFSIFVEAERPRLFYGGRPLPPIDAVIPRIGASITFFGNAVVRQFEQMGVFTLTPAVGIAMSRDKLRALQVLSRHDIGIPPSAFVRDRADVLAAIARVGGAPVIVKLLEGTQGIGVVLADSEALAEAIVHMLQVSRQNVLIQKFVAESKGKDIRAIVVGGRVVAAMRRRAQGQEFRSNLHRGARAEPVALDETYERAAVKAARILGLRVAGVDILEGAEGPQVLEVNSSPGLGGIEQATGVDVAGAILEHLEEQMHLPEVDLRQQLSLGQGYSVAELPKTADSPLANKTLREMHLADMEVLVLSIRRAGILLPAPRGATTILPGDRLVCYGKRQIMKELIPPAPAPKGGGAPAV